MSHPDPTREYGENEIGMKPSYIIRKLAEEYKEKYDFTVTAASLAAIVAYLDEQAEKRK